jgi:hypothetical protein
MVRIAGSDIPNLSKIVENAFDSVNGIYCGNTIDFDNVETEIDIDMNDNFEDYILDIDDNVSESAVDIP